MRINHLLTEKCNVETFDSTDERGHPTYKKGMEVPCKFLPFEERITKDENSSDNVKSGSVIIAGIDTDGNTVELTGKDRIYFSGVHYKIELLKFVKTIRGILSHYELNLQVSEI